MPKRQEIKEYNLMLQKYSVKKALIIFNRTVCNQEENLSAFILALSKRFIFLQLSNDFMLDGFAIIRLDDFDSIRHSSYERTQRKIFNSEGLLDNGFGFDKHLPLTSWTDIFKTLKKYDYHVIIEDIYKDENTSNGYLNFWIGEIKNVTDKSVSIHNYNPDGILDHKAKNINFDTISIVKFGDRYSTTFRKYLKVKSK